ncbi:MAG: NADH:ubiquinone reductase (Na(+)-transporting) subunit B [Bacteroidetes bacterium]|nr:NADH:ubiquinone reductase (Na(+)-transporting) subunit B [Bacteroidota bacterium]
MKFLREILDKQKPLFEKGGKFEKFYYLFEAQDTFMFSPNTTANNKGVQIRDAVDLKRMMITVVIAMLPCLFFGIWNVGKQHALSTGQELDLMAQILIGLKVVLPIVIVAYVAGGLVEVVFVVIRRHPLNEGYLVSGMLIPLVMPPTIPLWQVALASIFAVVIAKEAFGGTGMNVLNVALTARAFLYFAYPTNISGDVWTYFGDSTPADGFSGATALSLGAATTTGESSGELVAQLNQSGFSFMDMMLGYIPGSIGETSTIMCLIGALILVGTGVGSWKIIVSVFGGAYFMGIIFNLIGANDFMLLPAHYHWVIGGLAFGAVFMATDPVTAAQTEKGKWIYGFLIGVLTVLIRIFNPAYPEGIMLAILFMNVFAPLIDYYVVGANKKRRLKRATV